MTKSFSAVVVHKKKSFVGRSGTSASIETHATSVVYQNCALYSGSNMTFGMSSPPAPPAPAPGQNNQAVLQLLAQIKDSINMTSTNVLANAATNDIGIDDVDAMDIDIDAFKN